MKKSDLTEGWPQERGNEQLARFAESLRSALPELGPEAIARVQAAVRRAAADADATGPRRRGRAWAVRGSLAAAACLMLAAGVWLAYAHRDRSLPGDVNPPAVGRGVNPPTASGDAESTAAGQFAQGRQGGAGKPAAQAPAEDTYTVACGPMPVFEPDRPLVALEKYQGLLADR